MKKRFQWFPRIWRWQIPEESSSIVPVPEEEEQSEIPAEEDLLPLDPQQLSLARVLEQTILKDHLQCYFDENYTRLYLLIRDRLSHEQQIEGRIPLVILPEEQLVKLIRLLQQALYTMQIEQTARASLAAKSDDVWSLLSLNPSLGVTSVTTGELDALPSSLLQEERRIGFEEEVDFEEQEGEDDPPE